LLQSTNSYTCTNSLANYFTNHHANICSDGRTNEDANRRAYSCANRYPH
jgi:hypothetical protein